MRLKRKIIVIVDSVSNGALLAPAFLGRGFHCCLISTRLESLENQDAFFVKNFDIRVHSIEQILKELAAFEVHAVIPGDEAGVMLADEIAHYFPVSKNPLETSINRYHKFFMNDALLRAGVPCAKQFYSDNIDKILDWYHTCGIQKVVLKPAICASSEGVGICENVDEIKKIFHANIHKRNNLGKINEEYVIQEFLEGKHYLVNSVSKQGEHFITDMWEDLSYHEGIFLIDEYAENISCEHEAFSSLQKYTYQVLNALQLHNGPAHCEIKMTSDGPKLIEISARLMGGVDFSVAEEAYRYSQLSFTIDNILEPELFLHRTSLYKNILPKSLRMIYMFSYHEGEIIHPVDFSEFLNIPSFMSIRFDPTMGDMLKQSKHGGRPGYAMLLSDNPEELERDYAAFRIVENEFYLKLLGK